MTANCLHCGEPAGPSPVTVEADGKTAQFCCGGCHAAWVFITDAGLERYYTQRAAGKPVQVNADRFADYELADVVRHYVAIDAHGHGEVSLHIGGMRCAACVWLLEKVAGRTPGVDAFSVSFATHRATARFDPAVISLADLLRTLAEPGFDPEPVVAGEQTDAQVRERRTGLTRLAVAAIFGMQTMMLALALYLGDAYGMTAATRQLLEIASLVTTLPVLAYAGAPFFTNAWRGVAERRLGMDLPVALALSIAFTASVLATAGVGETVYFDSVAMFVLLLSASRFLELSARHHADDGTQALARMLPDAVDRLSAAGTTERVARRELRPGDRIRLTAGDTVPADGRIAAGELTVDEALLSGESQPCRRVAGEPVTAGAGVTGGGADIVVEKTGAATMLAGIGRLIERAGSTRSTFACLADRLAGRFVGGVLTVAAMAALAWMLVDTGRVLPVTLAVLIVACPCALALATPTALASATSRLARAGLLLTRPTLLEHFQPGATLLTDKTGTLTRGQPTLAATTTLGTSSDARCRELAAALESDSSHPLAAAFAPYRGALALDSPADEKAGRGVSGYIAGIEYRLGRAEFVAEIAGTFRGPSPDGLWLGHQGGWDAWFDVRDTLRVDAKATIAALQAAGIRVVIASGDGPLAVAAAATELGVTEWHAGLSPDAKLDLLYTMRLDGRNVIMIGDGVNDAPVLRAADASIAMGEGSLLARASADGVLMGERLAPLGALADVARATRRVIRQSVTWAITYNSIAVSAAAFGLVTPWLAAIGMSASSLLVVANAMRLRRAPEPGRRLANRVAGGLA